MNIGNFYCRWRSRSMPSQQPPRWPPRQPTLSTSSTSSSFQDKWVINLSNKELTPEEKSLLQKGPKICSYPSNHTHPRYISTTTVAAIQAGEPNGVDCSGLYNDYIGTSIMNPFTWVIIRHSIYLLNHTCDQTE